MPKRNGSSLRILVSGLIAQHPSLAGVAWDYVQYVVGLKQLGHDVYYVEDSGQWPYSLDGGATGRDWIVRDCKANIEHLDNVMRRWGLEERWAYHCPVESRWYGLSDIKRREVVNSADLLLNISGSLCRPCHYRRIPRLAYIDSDPVFTQVKLKLKRGHKQFQDRAAIHDVFFSFGERLSNWAIDTSYEWIPTRQPIVLSEWRPKTPSRTTFTTVMNWTSYRPLRYGGETYGQKDVEFRQFCELPRLVGNCSLEVAMANIHHANWETNPELWPESLGSLLKSRPDWTPQEVLSACGWGVVDAGAVGKDLDSYRAYIESSMAECSVAKNGYVTGQVGWFSCRSACYLAAGKPVVVQDTGFSDVLPSGEGILPFRTLEEAASAIESVQQKYDAHCAAASAIAAHYFDARKVLPALLQTAVSDSRVIKSPGC